MSFDVIIRTFNSAETIEFLITSLLDSEYRPNKIIIVDSGSVDCTKDICKNFNCTILDYNDLIFNYSKSLNLGINEILSDYCLIISSHIEILDKGFLKIMLNILSSNEIVATYIDYLSKSNKIEIISKKTFNGCNGIWNVCAMYKTEFLKKYYFNEKIPTAEDQYFASKIFESGLFTAKISGKFINYTNKNYSLKKVRNEKVAIAVFVYKKDLELKNIFRYFKFSVTDVMSFSFHLAFHHFLLGFRLLFALFKEPKFNSKYFLFLLFSFNI